MVELRAPVPADAEVAARCHLDCWAEAYAELADPVRLAAMVGGVEERVSRWHDIIRGRTVVRLADDGGRVVGFVSVGPSRDRVTDSDPELEVYALYTRRAYWDTGLGHRLLEAGLGARPASLWVLSANERARRFYARHGFGSTGTEQLEPHLGAVEVRLVRPGPFADLEGRRA